MFVNSIVLASVAIAVSASPLAMPEPEPVNVTQLDVRQVLTTNLYAVWNTQKWETTVARMSNLSLAAKRIILRS